VALQPRPPSASKKPAKKTKKATPGQKEMLMPIARKKPAKEVAAKKPSVKPHRKTKLSAGILAYRRGPHGLEVLLVHPGGPFWRHRDDGAWSIPKGEIDQAEDPEQAARREFTEELGPAASIGPLQPLGKICNAAASGWSHSTEKVNLMRQGLPAIRSNSSGRPAADASRPFRKSTAPSGRSRNREGKDLSGQIELIDSLAELGCDGLDRSECETVSR
jgi:ADP-ribose pyrophosphatase YjhB (NUDIX family)